MGLNDSQYGLCLPTNEFQWRVRLSSQLPLGMIVASFVVFAFLTPVTGQENQLGKEIPNTFRVVSYNIKHCRGNDNRVDLARTAAVIEKLSPDFVGLQEVDENAKRSNKVDQVTELAKRLEMNPAFGSFMDFQGGRYGMGILSKHPIKKVTSVKLPKGNEPRVALAAEVALPSGDSIMLVNVHFDWVKDDAFRFAQAQTLRGYLDNLDIAYILLGDFNDQRGSRTLELLSRDSVDALKPADDSFTFSSDKPTVEIDFIFAAPQSKWSVQKVKVIDEPIASDHRPVLAVLQAN